MGRPTKCTPEVLKLIEEAFKLGAYFEPACNYAGIGPSTGYEWLALDREEYERLLKPPADRPPKNKRHKPVFSEFSEVVARADARREVGMSGVLMRAATGTPDKQGDWRAAAWWLERRHPERWGQQIKTEAKVEIGLSETIVGIVQSIRDRMERFPALPGQVVDAEFAEDET